MVTPGSPAAHAQEPARQVLDTRASAAPAPAPSPRERFARRRLGGRAMLTLDPVTGTVRSLQARAGVLSGVAAGDRAAVALDWVREHRAALGLTAGDVDALAPAGRIATPGTGITHVQFQQAAGGIPAFHGGLGVSLDRGGRILNVSGAPATGLRAPSVPPRLGPVAALRALQRDVGVPQPVEVVSGPSGVRRETRFATGDLARLVLFGSGRATRLGWHLTYLHYDAVVDAATGAVLYRQDLTRHDADAVVFESHPGNAAPIDVDLEDEGWLPDGADVLSGQFAHTYSDVNDNDQFSASEEIPRTPSDDFRHMFMSFGACGPDALCSWNPASPGSWQTNRRQNGVQAFYLVNRFRDHLAGDPQIAFNGFSGVDALRVETDDGAGTGPNNAHTNNATMSTPPDGVAPQMQLFLFRGGGFRNVNGGDSAAIVWHEYTHGLSSRLVTWADGTAALSSAHAGAMGEGWSDWYALDLLDTLGLSVDTAAPGEMYVGHYIDAPPRNLRTQPVDCPVGAPSSACPAGGYTFGDFASGGPEVHEDGEIWAETLWDLRRVLGSNLAQALITAGMRMSPPEPSFLDMRNAILAAEAGLPGDHRLAVWSVFAARGMGYYAAADDAGDLSPTEDFNLPPSPASPRGRTIGTVTSADTGFPLANVTVGFGGLSTPVAFADRLATATAANGTYAIDAPAAQYGELSFTGPPGYDRVAVPGFQVAAGQTRVQDVALRRDWAASAGGATVLRDGTRYDDTGAQFGCGLSQLIDQRSETGWSAWNPGSNDPDNPHLGPPTAVVRLPTAIDVTAFGLDPTHTCENFPGASTAGYRIETSADGVTFSVANQGTFGAADRGRLTVVPAAAAGVRYVRLTLLSSQSAGSDFIDFSELEVFGGPPNRLPTGSLAASRVRLNTGVSVDFAATFVDLDSRITGYDWDFDGNGTVDRSTAEPTTSFAYGTPGTFNATVAARDFRGGAGTAARQLTVTRPARPRFRLPKRGSKGKLTFRVTCAVRCTLSGTLKVNRRTVRRIRRTITTTAERRIAVTLPRKVRRAARRRDGRTVRAVLSVAARYADGRRTTAKRTVRIRL